jgi:hypothetical protein
MKWIIEQFYLWLGKHIETYSRNGEYQARFHWYNWRERNWKEAEKRCK